MTDRHRRRRESARGALSLMLLGVLLLGAGAVIAAGAGPRLVADDLGTVPASAGPAGTSTAGVAGGAPLRPVPASQVLPVLARPAPADPAPAGPPGPRLPGELLPGPAADRPGSGDTGPGSTGPAAARPQPPRDTGPAPLAATLPWTVSPIYPVPAGAAPSGPPEPVLPATLELPDRGVVAPVESVGTGPNGGMVVPEQVRTVGWWAPGVLPGGGTGSAVIAGHVDSATQGFGVLAVLPQLTMGEPVVVRSADGRAATFRVAARREYGKQDLPREVFRRDGDPQLVLITCGGVFDPVAGSYESNIVVYAVPEPT